MSAPAASEAPSATPAKPSALRRFFALDPLDNRYPALHGVRFFAILSVVQYHVTGVFKRLHGPELNEDLSQLSTRIFFGMDLFFILSGFLIGSILIYAHDQHGKLNAPRFYLRRMFRTFPSYYVILTILALTKPLTRHELGNLPFEYAFLTNFTKLGSEQLVMGWGWSLSIEEQFYLVAPLLFWLLFRLPSNRARIVFLLGTWSLGTVVRLGIWLSKPAWTNMDFMHATYFRTYTRFDTIICGILLALVQIRYGEAIGRWLMHPFHRALVAIPGVACLWVLLHPAVFDAAPFMLSRVFLWGTFTCVMYFSAILLLLHSDNTFTRFLSAPLFRRLATLGYGVYLVHVPILEFLMPAANALDARGVSTFVIWGLALVAVMLLALVVGYVMHILIEKPALRLRQRMAG